MKTANADGCPFCGGQPSVDVVKHRNCGEPYFRVQLFCERCGVSMSAVATDKECDEASDIGRAQYAKGDKVSPYDVCVAHVVVKNRLLPHWNTRVTNTTGSTT